jgi:hypothetical protein
VKGFGSQAAIIKEYLLSPIHVHDNVYIPYLYCIIWKHNTCEEYEHNVSLVCLYTSSWNKCWLLVSIAMDIVSLISEVILLRRIMWRTWPNQSVAIDRLT